MGILIVFMLDMTFNSLFVPLEWNRSQEKMQKIHNEIAYFKLLVFLIFNVSTHLKFIFEQITQFRVLCLVLITKDNWYYIKAYIYIYT
jgi:hypothetical protein